MQIYNARNLDSNQKFIFAIIAGLITAIVLGIAYGWIVSIIHIESAILYIAIGFCVGYVIRNVGRGVHQRFSILGGIMTALAIFLGDIFSYIGFAGFFSFLINPSLWGAFFQFWIAGLLAVDISSILSLILRIMGIYFGYHYARIL